MEMLDNLDRIRPYEANPFYWQYKGQPVLLLGGSVEDNLFQIPNLETHLNLLEAVGGNYVRSTMSSRDEGDVWPFARDPETGLYDLTELGETYWTRFERFLEMTAERNIFLQIEVWDRFDFAREPWQHNPYNPKNNVNYTEEASGLKHVIETHPGRKENAFFRSVPALENNEVVLEYQQKQVDKMLSLSLPYGHVLYCMDNETNESPAWGAYWADYILEKAEEAGVEVSCTEMWDDWNLLGDEHKATFEHPERYAFVDVSQGNHQPASTHWTNMQGVRTYLLEEGPIRPMNSVKIYGANTGRYGSTRDAQERFWRNIFGGLASSRFHRPTSGLGLNPIAQSHIRSMRMLLDRLDIMRSEPHNDLLTNRSWNEAYCTAIPGEAYAVFFPDGGNVWLDVSAADIETLRVDWLDIRASRWSSPSPDVVSVIDDRLYLVTPTEEGYWAAWIGI
jgi:hypothetical protein